MSALGIIGIVALVVVLLIVFWFIGVYNGIKVSGIKVSEALSGIDVALTKRYDVLTKMLDVTKGYMNYEKETLMKIVQLRSGMSMNERNNANREMDNLSREFRILAEHYPELRSSNNFVELQRSIADVEEHLQAARRLYNSNVTDYNRRIITVPNNIVAGMMGATQKAFFEADEIKKNDVNMTF
ncbi:MAG: LemA family protein [Eubacterium sp.]|nr:LemA family protein [Eubacterium sp.]